MLWLAYILLFLYGLAHTPILVDILRQFFPHWNIQRLTSSASSVILILLLTFFFLLSLGMHLFVFIPYMPQVTLRPVKLVMHCLFAYWVWINAVGNYIYTLFSRPGIFRPSLKKGSTAHSSNDTTTHSVKVSEGGKTSVCNQKGNSGTENSGTENMPNHGQDSARKSYCKICQESIPYRDHHCPFTGNCIGLRNYSYFYLGLFYSMLGLGYSVVIFFVYFGNCLSLAWKASDIPLQSDEVCTNFEPYGEMVLPTIGALVTMTIVFLFHTFLLLADVSTYDLLKHWRTIKIDLRRFQGQNSRLRTLFLNQRAHPLWFLLPVKNTD